MNMSMIFQYVMSTLLAVKKLKPTKTQTVKKMNQKLKKAKHVKGLEG